MPTFMLYPGAIICALARRVKVPNGLAFPLIQCYSSRMKHTTPNFRCLVLLGLVVLSVGCATAGEPREFDGKRAYAHVTAQMNFGLRPSGTAANRATSDYFIGYLKSVGWAVETQEFVYRGVPVRNVIGKIGKGPLIVLGAHFDTRLRADQDKQHPDQGVPGANDGASGAAVLLELARSIDPSKLKNEVWFAFFDAEDNGEIDGCVIAPAPCQHDPWPWSVGADYLAEHLTTKPSIVVILDMIGDADQDIYFEQNSDRQTMEELWAIGARLGYKQFIPQFKWSMDDDHTPFLIRGIRAVDVIDFDYPYWHTIQDTADKVSADSLERVGRVMKTWLEGK